MAAAPETMAHPHLIRPEQPRNIKEAGISARCVEGLILKTIKQEGSLTIEQLADHMVLPIHVFREMVLSLHHREILDTPAPMTYDLTNKGRELLHHYEAEDTYVGQAPVSFDAYCEAVIMQAKRGRRVSDEEFSERFKNLPAPMELKRLLKEAYNGKEVMILWGPPGAGKSMWSGMMQELMEDDILVPYAFEYNGRCVKIYEPAYHKLKEDKMKAEEEATAGMMTTTGKPDRRWLISSPPYVVVGAEFRVEHFMISFDGQYDAPPHVKANNGIFIFDDLGRQTQDHNMILNQFIYPLEQKETIVKFAGGSSLRIPYQQRLFLSTNLNFRSIIDDAFSRRLLFQVLVDRPTNELFKKIFVLVSKQNHVEEELAWELARRVLGWYKRDGRVIRASDSRDIYRMLSATLDDGQKLGDVLTFDTFERVYSQYPMALEVNATGYKVELIEVEDFQRRLKEVLESHEVDSDIIATLAENAPGWLNESGTRVYRPADPTNLLAIVDGEREASQTIKDYLTEEIFERICRAYPNFTQADVRRMEGTTGLGGK